MFTPEKKNKPERYLEIIHQHLARITYFEPETALYGYKFISQVSAPFQTTTGVYDLTALVTSPLEAPLTPEPIFPYLHGSFPSWNKGTRLYWRFRGSDLSTRHFRHIMRHLPIVAMFKRLSRLPIFGAMGASYFTGKVAPLAIITKNRYLILLVSRCTNRRFMLAIATTSTLTAKAVHIYAHHNALIAPDLWTWGLSFFSQDTMLLLTIRLLLDKQLLSPVPWLASAALGIASFIITFVLALATCNISFFSMAGNEIHWRNIGFVADPSSMGYLLMGLATSILTFCSMIIISWVAQDACHYILDLALGLIGWPFKLLWTRAGAKIVSRRNRASQVEYIHLHQNELEPLSEEEEEFEQGEKCERSTERSQQKRRTVICYVAIGLFLLTQALDSMLRPLDKSFIFISWTLPLIPFVDFVHGSTSLFDLLPVFGAGIGTRWDNMTALGKPINLTWLPLDALPGFDDWYSNNTSHYRADQDPFKISNLDTELHEALKDKLSDVNIRHIVLVKLESTRKDVFPFKKDSTFWKALADSFPDSEMPLQAQDRLTNLTPAANFITGDYNDGFDHQEQRKRGGINFNNAETTSSYTLKSLTATLCGLSPLVADWNVEVENHIYQPCLPHILKAFDGLNEDDATEKNDFTNYKWKSLYIQSVNGEFDHQATQMPQLGYAVNEVINLQYLNGESPTHGKIEIEKGRDMVPEYNLEPYIRDALASAKQNNERLFLTHLTSTTHAPFETFEEDSGDQVSFASDANNVASKYLNTIGYVDKWIARLLGILDDEGVADETLVIFLGDHGLAIAETGGVTPYYAWREKTLHIPMVLSHPKLPSFDVDDAVVSIQILPTILDLLRETGSLSEQGNKAALELMENYEGQSLLRPGRTSSDRTGQPNWQFTVMNPGRSTISVRDPQHIERHIIVPAVEDVEWRFTLNLNDDPVEAYPVVDFSFRRFIRKIEAQHDSHVAKWAESAAFAARWWMKDNRQRWRYDPKE